MEKRFTVNVVGWNDVLARPIKEVVPREEVVTARRQSARRQSKKCCYGRYSKAAITGWIPSPFTPDSTPPTKHAYGFDHIKRALFLEDSASSGEEEVEERGEVKKVALCTKSAGSRGAKRKIGSESEEDEDEASLVDDRAARGGVSGRKSCLHLE
jgi:hypothetical protein